MAAAVRAKVVAVVRSLPVHRNPNEGSSREGGVSFVAVQVTGRPLSLWFIKVTSSRCSGWKKNEKKLTWTCCFSNASKQAARMIQPCGGTNTVRRKKCIHPE